MYFCNWIVQTFLLMLGSYFFCQMAHIYSHHNQGGTFEAPPSREANERFLISHIFHHLIIEFLYCNHQGYINIQAVDGSV